jgi:cytochrome b
MWYVVGPGLGKAENVAGINQLLFVNEHEGQLMYNSGNIITVHYIILLVIHVTATIRPSVLNNTFVLK